MKQVGKRLLSLLLALCMLMSLCVSALAADEVTVKATLDTPTLYRKSVAQTVKLAVAVDQAINIDSYGMQIKVPNGWTITAMECNDANVKDGEFEGNPANGMISWMAPDLKPRDIKDMAVVTVEIPANTPAGKYTLSVEQMEANTNNGYDEVLTEASNVSATLTIKEDDGGADFQKYYRAFLYTGVSDLKLGTDKNVGSVEVDILDGIINKGGTYNAYEVTLSYDPAILEFVRVADIDGVYRTEDDKDNGTVTVYRSGNEKTCGARQGFMAEFKGIGPGSCDVNITRAYVDKGENANIRNAPTAAIVSAGYTFKVTGPYYKVTTNYTNEINYAPEALANTDYSFTLKEGLNWKGLIFRYTIDGVLSDEMLYDATNKCYTIPASKVTGDIHIDGYNRSFDVVVEGNAVADVTLSKNKVTYRGEPLTFTLDKQDGWTYTVSVTTANEPVDYQVSEDDTTYTLLGNSLYGYTVITVNKTKGDSQISFDGDTSDLEGEAIRNAPVGKDFPFTIKKDANYDYTVGAKYTESGVDIPVKDNGDGTYTIEGKYINGDAITITITKTAKWKWTVKVTEYVKVGNAQSVFLITAKLNDGVTLDAGSTLAYGDELMYRNEARYEGAYAYLLFSDKTQDEVKAEAETEGKISIVTGEAHTFSLTGDVNGTERIDVNDVQMVYNMYNAKYTAFDANTTMEKFLAADLNGDRMITVDDAVAVVNKIK